MLFITPALFEFEPVKIHGVSDNGSLKLELARFIGIYEKQCLIEVLGACLYKEIQDSYTFLDGVFTIKPDATQAIKDLVNGIDYDAPESSGSFIDPWFDASGMFWGSGSCGCGCGSSACDKRYWKGFVQTDEYLQGTALADLKRSFIADYIYYQHSLINRSVTTGTGQQTLDAENSTKVQNFSKRIDRYNEFIFSVIGRKNETSLYRFLYDHKADYPTWVPNCSLKFKDKF
jgi:hypothetical protein